MEAVVKFRVWQDLNGDGVSDTGELRTLDDAGVRSLSLASAGEIETRPDGTRVFGRGTYTTGSEDSPVGRELLDLSVRVAPWGFREAEGSVEFRWTDDEESLSLFVTTSDEPVTLTSRSRNPRWRWSGWSRRPGSPALTSSSSSCPRATTRCSRSAAPTSRADSASASPSPARSRPTRGCWCSTRRRARSRCGGGRSRRNGGVPRWSAHARSASCWTQGSAAALRGSSSGASARSANASSPGTGIGCGSSTRNSRRWPGATRRRWRSSGTGRRRIGWRRSGAWSRRASSCAAPCFAPSATAAACAGGRHRAAALRAHGGGRGA